MDTKIQTRHWRAVWFFSALVFIVFSVSCASTKNAADGDIVKEVVSTVLVESQESWDGMALPSYPEGSPEVTILRIKIPPNTKLSVHKHPYINAGVLLRGELTVVKEDGGNTPGEEKIVLKAGDPIVEVVDRWHYGQTGDEMAEIIVFYLGEKDGQAITILKD